jgi:hypothetical protein
MWGPILGGFTILGVFLTLSAWINGRSIKKYIGQLIIEEAKANRELMREITDGQDKITATLDKISERSDKSIAHLEKLSEEHRQMIEYLKS